MLTFMLTTDLCQITVIKAKLVQTSPSTAQHSIAALTETVWSLQYVTLLFIGVISATSLRGFLKNTQKVSIASALSTVHLAQARTKELPVDYHVK